MAEATADSRPTTQGTANQDLTFPSLPLERFGLTPMESLVAAALAEGLTYKEIAGQFGISYHTVHSHVKAIHGKTGVRTNGRLLALIYGRS